MHVHLELQIYIYIYNYVYSIYIFIYLFIYLFDISLSTCRGITITKVAKACSQRPLEPAGLPTIQRITSPAVSHMSLGVQRASERVRCPVVEPF